MGRYYGEKILAGILTIGDVPALWKSATQNWLNEQEKE